MKNQLKQMIKSVLDENAVGFKDSTSNVLYQKVSKKLEDQYKKQAKKIFEGVTLDEELSMGSGISQQITPSTATMAQSSPGGQSRDSSPGESSPSGAPPKPVFPNRSKEPWKSMSDEEFREVLREYELEVRRYQEWYRQQQEERARRIRERVHPGERRRR